MILKSTLKSHPSKSYQLRAEAFNWPTCRSPSQTITALVICSVTGKGKDPEQAHTNRITRTLHYYGKRYWIRTLNARAEGSLPGSRVRCSVPMCATVLPQLLHAFWSSDAQWSDSVWTKHEVSRLNSLAEKCIYMIPNQGIRNLDKDRPTDVTCFIFCCSPCFEC